MFYMGLKIVQKKIEKTTSFQKTENRKNLNVKKLILN